MTAGDLAYGLVVLAWLVCPVGLLLFIAGQTAIKASLGQHRLQQGARRT